MYRATFITCKKSLPTCGRISPASSKNFLITSGFPAFPPSRSIARTFRACAEWLLAHCKKIGLDAQLRPTDGNPIITAKTPRGKTKRPHFVVYGHYDVQPAEPFEPLENAAKFPPRIEGNAMFARGASDNKGQNLAHLKAVEAYLKTGTELPCDLTFVIEGEEEVGSKSLAAFLKKNSGELKCDAVEVSGHREFPVSNILRSPTPCAASRRMELTVHGPSRDLHSGLFSAGRLKIRPWHFAELLAKLAYATKTAVS